MSPQIKKYCPFGIALATLLCLNATSDASQVYTVTHSGWSEGAIIEGWFVGTDQDMDGQLTFFDGEITAGNFSWSGNSLIPAAQSENFGIIYDINDGPTIGDGTTLAIEGIFVIFSDTVFYSSGEGPGPFPGGAFHEGAGEDGPLLDSTELNAMAVKQSNVIPEPSTFIIWGFLALAGAAIARRRR